MVIWNFHLEEENRNLLGILYADWCSDFTD